MHGLSSHALQIFDGPDSGSTNERAPGSPSPLSPDDVERAECLACQETWRPFPSRRPTSEHEPYTLPWHQQIEQRRYARHGRWIPGLLEFHRHPGEEVLGLGQGLGTDWVQYTNGGASVHFLTPSKEQLGVVRQNFQLRGLNGKFHQGSLESMPYGDNTMDVVCLAALGAGFELTPPTVNEIFRVLKPGGKILALVHARFNSRYWQDFWFPWNSSEAPRTGANEQFTAHGLRRLFDRFGEHRIYKRHLRRSDLPHVWRWMLLPLLERVMGRFLLLKAFKPVNSAIALNRSAA